MIEIQKKETSSILKRDWVHEFARNMVKNDDFEDIERAFELLELKNIWDLKNKYKSISLDKDKILILKKKILEDSICPAFDQGLKNFAIKISVPLMQEAKKSLSVYKNYIVDMDNVLNVIRQNFEEKIMNISYRTLVLELNYLRESKKLVEENYENQFTEYITYFLSDDEYYNILDKKYPALFQIIISEFLKADSALKELLDNYKTDCALLQKDFQYEFSRIKQIDMGKGDNHNNGHTVAKVTLNNNKIIYYKPRNSEIDNLYEKIVELYNKKKNNEDKIKTINTVAVENRGWTEEVKYEQLSCEEDASKFYTKLGIQLAFLYSLNAVDFHSENLIANGENPVLIDLESIFSIKEVNNIEIKNAKDLSMERLGNTVNAVGILPFKFGTNEKSDVSGIGHSEKKESFIKVPQIKNGRTSKMTVEREYISLERSQNHPEWNGKSIDEKKYYLDVIKGFTSVYLFIMSNSKKMIETVENYKEKIRLRYIPKPTMYYGNLLSLSMHPVVMQNEVGREIFFTKLYLDDKPGILLQNEYRDLLNYDIPYFSYYLDSCDLDTSIISEQKISHFFKESALKKFMIKINHMNINDLNFQIMRIKNSFGLLEFSDVHAHKDFVKPAKTNEIFNIVSMKKVGGEKLLNRAVEIAEYVIDISDHVGDTYSWFAAQINGGIRKKDWNASVMGNSLYDGLSGMSFFFLSLYIINKDDKYFNIAKDILEEILNEESNIKSNPIGAFDGIFSIVYLLTYFYANTNDIYYVSKIDEYLEKTNELEEWKDNTYDVIGGSAGILLVLLNVSHIYKNLEKTSESLRRQLLFHVNEIIDNCTWIDEHTAGWISVDTKPLTGFAHGNTGICYALEQFINGYTFEGDVDKKIIKKLITCGIKYEMDQRKNGKWFDLRKDSEYSGEHYPYAWCHGEPGILLGMMHIKDSGMEGEKELCDMFSNAFGRNHSLCHGDLGNALIIKDISCLLKSKIWDSVAFHYAKSVVENYELKDMKIGLGIDMSTPELMIGLAGMGYSLMYIYDNQKLPNILRLEMKGTYYDN